MLDLLLLVKTVLAEESLDDLHRTESVIARKYDRYSPSSARPTIKELGRRFPVRIRQRVDVSRAAS